MKISIDAGALCGEKNKRYGNHIVTTNLLKALHKWDKKNKYYLYGFSKKPEDLAVNKKIRYQILYPKKLWMKLRVSLEELSVEKNIFLALNQALPLFTNANIIAFSHGLSFYFFPKLYTDYPKLKKQLTDIIKRSKLIIVSSEKVKKEFKKIFPKFKNIIVLPFGIPHDFLDNARLGKNNRLLNEKYFVYVGMNHPIKNLEFVQSAFKRFVKDKRFKDHKLYIASDKNRIELKELYQNATALLTASQYESYNIPVLEALSQNTQVIGLKSAIIPEFESYVHVVRNKKEFVSAMKNVALGQVKNIDQAQLRQDFSWEKYVKKLVKLYV